MKNFIAFLGVAAVGAVLLFPAGAEAGLIFGRNKKSNCNMVNGKCTIHERTGTANQSGTVGGPITTQDFVNDPEIREYQASIGYVPAVDGLAVVEAPAIPSAPTANGGHVTESVRAPAVPAAPVQEAAGPSDAKAAAELVKLNREILAASKDAHGVAMKAEQRAIDRLAENLDEQIAELQRQRADLEPTPAE